MVLKQETGGFSEDNHDENKWSGVTSAVVVQRVMRVMMALLVGKK
jgi:hypothetical protein